MKRNEYWNDVASKGAILGAMMLAFYILEQTIILKSSSMGVMLLASVCDIAVCAVYVWLLYRFSKRAAERYGDEMTGYSYSQGLLYVLWTAVFAGVIAGFGRYVYMHWIVGYDNYVEHLLDTMQRLMANMGGTSPAMYNALLSSLAEQQEPGIFATISSSIFSYGFWGMLVGLFIAAGVKREPNLFDGGENNDKESNE